MKVNGGVMRTFYFTDDSYWSSNGCDCCEADFMEAYNSEQVAGCWGTAHCEEECIIQAITTVIEERTKGGWDVENDFLYYLHRHELHALCKAMEISVEIEEQGGSE